MNDFDNQFKGFKRTAGWMILLTVLGNLIFWGGLIFLVFWLLNHFNVI